MVRARLADIQFLVIDSRRGAADDKQHEKVLAVYPPVQDSKLLLWAVGMHLGTYTFAQSTGQVCVDVAQEPCKLGMMWQMEWA